MIYPKINYFHNTIHNIVDNNKLDDRNFTDKFSVDTSHGFNYNGYNKYGLHHTDKNYKDIMEYISSIKDTDVALYNSLIENDIFTIVNDLERNKKINGHYSDRKINKSKIDDIKALDHKESSVVASSSVNNSGEEGKNKVTEEQPLSKSGSVKGGGDIKHNNIKKFMNDVFSKEIWGYKEDFIYIDNKETSMVHILDLVDAKMHKKMSFTEQSISYLASCMKMNTGFYNNGMINDMSFIYDDKQITKEDFLDLRNNDCSKQTNKSNYKQVNKSHSEQTNNSD